MDSKKVAQGMFAANRTAYYHFYKKYLTHRYRFSSPFPYHRQSLSHRIVCPHQQINKNQNKSSVAVVYCMIFLGSFALADALYAGFFNTKQEYRLRVLHPQTWHYLDTLVEQQHIRKKLQLASRFWVKDQYEFNAFWQDFQAHFSTNQQQQRMHDERVAQLNQQIKEAETKYPNLLKDNNKNVF